jgi:vacuolar protein sorting-associated protein 13A/C
LSSVKEAFSFFLCDFLLHIECLPHTITDTRAHAHARSALASIDSAPIKLNSMLVKDAYGDVATLLQPIIRFYVGQGIREAYKVLFSIEILGNPVKLLSGVKDGVKDFFYEPAMGLVSSPKDFGTGLAKGTGSLLKKVTGGVFEAAGKITGSVGKGVASMTLDQQFMKEREALNKEKVTGMAGGLVKGAKSLGKGIWSGITGIVVDPFQGARRGGVAGFFKGLGKGLTGVVTKTVSGALDFATNTFQGLNATVQSVGGGAGDPNGRRRMPRFITPGGALQPYSAQV